jgi:hypothetical protein
MRTLNNFKEANKKAKENMLKEISDFFTENPFIEKIDIVEVEGEDLNVRGDKMVDSIYSDRVTGYGGEFDFEELDLCDLECIIDIINNWIVDFDKTMKRCED